jgi:hypothetical protein
MNENNKSFYPSDVFEFIHHSKYGCHDLKGLNIQGRALSYMHHGLMQLSSQQCGWLRMENPCAQCSGYLISLPLLCEIICMVVNWIGSDIDMVYSVLWKSLSWKIIFLRCKSWVG